MVDRGICGLRGLGLLGEEGWRHDQREIVHDLLRAALGARYKVLIEENGKVL
jgi:hypothetical protein